MIVQSMVYSEVKAELSKDMESLWAYYGHQKKRIERAARGARSFPCCHFMEYTSPRKNRWLIATHIFRKFVHKGGAGCMFCCLQKYPRGWALHCQVLNRNLRPYTLTILPHVFDQYVSRIGLEKSGIEVIKHFIIKNMNSQNDFTKKFSGRKSRERETESAHLCMSEGILMGEVMDEDHIVIHTFITYDMTTGKQKEVFEQRRSEIGDAGEQHKRAWYGEREPVVKNVEPL